jgi:quercetin dioxygenase-like cupin family protein
VAAGTFRRDRLHGLEAEPAESPYAGRAAGYRRQQLAGGPAQAVHTAFAAVALDDGGSVDAHRHSCEESFFVLEGTPWLRAGPTRHRLTPGDGGLIPVGALHAWEAEGATRWVEMHSPRPVRTAGRIDDTFFPRPPSPMPGESEWGEGPTVERFRFRPGDMEIATPAAGGDDPAPATINAALLTFSGIRIRMLVDRSIGAALHTMFVVQAQPGGGIDVHDHPFEEAYLVLDGEVIAEAAGERFELRRNDFLWTGVGCPHAFANRGRAPVRWLEVQAPQPPARHAFRFHADWVPSSHA